MSDSDSLTPKPRLLLIDDEVGITNALRRLFRPHGYQIEVAESGEAGIALCREKEFDLVISDMRMPGLDGAQTLETIRALQPHCIRLLLTGYADMRATIDAINRGKIYRYISKPWDDEEVLAILREAFEFKSMADENRRLQALTQAQNHALQSLNDELEQRVQDRTKELQQTYSFLDLAHQHLQTTFAHAVRTFANLIELRSPLMAGHSKRVADLAQGIALRMGLNEAECRTIFFAGLLHDIGKIGLPDHLMIKPITTMQSEELKQIAKHVTKGEAALMSLEELRPAAQLIRLHHERYDGQGYPDNLAGEGIPLGARILAVAEDFDELQMGLISPKKLSAEDARDFIHAHKGKRYDPRVVDYLSQEHAAQKQAIQRPVRTLSTDALRAGMVLAQDLISHSGILLLAKDFKLDNDLIRQLASFERTDGHLLDVVVYRE
ncbi:HD domain-containing phosphohydrolase [Parvibium lacunae]|uniref:HD domain-containing phosphohydrolase n=1 Tax=Parvibium lacunae TaxID=1888893 RepID=UPI001960964A|nr:HD domain-containing phosphohydrolase [Parvibium lacunae]